MTATVDVHCHACDQPVPDRANLCHRCTSRLAANLHHLADLAADLDDTVARLDRIHRTGGRPQPDPWHPDDTTHVRPARETAHWPAIHIRDTATTTTTTWARHVAHTRGLALPEPATQAGPTCSGRYGCRHPSCGAIWEHARPSPLAAAAAWLAGHTGWLRTRPEATQAYDDLDGAHAAVLRAVDTPPALAYYGPCDPHALACPAHLYGPARAGTIRCPDCGTGHDAAARRVWLLEQAGDQLLGAADMARVLSALGRPVTAAAIRGYAHRGRLTARGTADYPLYRVSEARQLVDTPT